MKAKQPIFYILILAALLASCAPPEIAPPEEVIQKVRTGTLNLSFSTKELSSRALLPGVDRTVSTYDIFLSGPEGASREVTGKNDNTLTISGLEAGSWNIKVDGKNAEDVKLTTGTASFEMTAKESISVQVTLSPLEGTGTLDISLSWPENLLTAPSVTGTLTPKAGTPITITPAIEGTTASFKEEKLSAGYYLLSLKLQDGTTPLCSIMESVLIMAGQTTSGTMNLTAQQINGPPAAPTGFTATVISDTEIALSWTDSSITETGFAIQRRLTGSDAWEDLPQTAAGITSFSDSGLDWNTSYTYRAGAINQYGTAYSETADIKTHMHSLELQISPETGSYFDSPPVTLSCDVPEAEIRYTTDGTTPDKESGLLYSEPIVFKYSTTIKALAFLKDHYDSPVVTGEYTVTGVVLPPAFDLPHGDYPAPQSLILSTGTAGAQIYYTTEGSTPDASAGILYSGSITLEPGSDVTITAIGIKDGYTPSDITSQSYRVADQPIFSLEGGTFNTEQTLSLSGHIADTDIYYTTDGNTPSASNGTLYTEPINIDGTMEIQARIIREGWPESVMIAYNYTLMHDPPVFSLEEGTYNSEQTLTLSGNSEGFDIYYIYNNDLLSWPDLPLYTAPINIERSMRVSAVIFKEGWSQSETSTRTYTLRAPAPELLALSQDWEGADIRVTLTSALDQSKIYYTTDSTTPTTEDSLYTVPVSINNSTTITAIAAREGWSDSEPVTFNGQDYKRLPDNGTTYYNKAVDFNWPKMEGAQGYNLRIADTPDFMNAVYQSEDLTYHGETVNTLTGGKHYYWQVRMLQNDSWSDWSEAYSFFLAPMSFQGGEQIGPSFDMKQIHSVDLNNDGHMDILSGTPNGTIGWLKNSGSGSFTYYSIDYNFYRLGYLYPADMDGDGDTDILACDKEQWHLVWWENRDGSFLRRMIDGEAFIEPEIPDDDYTEIHKSDNYFTTCASDIDRDGDMDVVGILTIQLNYDIRLDYYSDWENHEVNKFITYIWENDGNQIFTRHTINEKDEYIGELTSIYPVDINEDGLTDIVSNKIFLENLGNFNFTESIYINNYFIFPGDTDKDGDIDLMYTYKFFYWKEQTMSMNFWNHSNLRNQNANSGSRIFSMDIEGDGDQDILWTTDDEFGFFGQEGNTAFTNKESTAPNHTYSLTAADIDGDGMAEIIRATGEGIYLHKIFTP